MTNPFDSTSTASDKTVKTDDFSIRTMKDDLLNIQTSGHIAQPLPKVSEFAEEKNTEPQSSPAIETSRPVYQKEPVAETPSPFHQEKPAETKQAQAVKMVETQPQEDFNDDEKPFLFKLVMTIVVILIISIIALSGYYYWMTTKVNSLPTPEPSSQSENTPEAPTPTATPEEQAPAVITPPAQKYSTDKPNFLVMDLTASVVDGVKESLIKTATELKTIASSQSLYEFTAVDANNDPISFSSFASATKLNLSPAFISALGDTFSLYMYNDNGNIRAGLSLSISKEASFATELQKQEKSLPSDLAILFLDTTPETTTGAFNDNTYNGHKTRYLNLNTAATLSVDYSVANSKLLIGTSRLTLRSILDRQAGDSTTTQTSQINAPSNTPTPQTVQPQPSLTR